VPVPTYSQSRRLDHGSGITVLVSGQCGVDDAGRVVDEDDLVAQARCSVQRIERELAAHGLSGADVVSVQVHLTDIGVLDEVERARAHWGGTPPASTAVQVAALAHPGAGVEISATAHRSAGPPVYEISKEFAFCASHQLHGMPEGHPCGRLHGHNYRVQAVLGSDELDEHGFVSDYGELAPLRKHIDATYDHRHLNEVLDHPQPSAERLAEHVYRWGRDHLPTPLAARLVAVGVSETPATWAYFRPRRVGA
jgi:6-pyruvoyltetrahydropterin/6-carboxytetrahydropterin synthase